MSRQKNREPSHERKNSNPSRGTAPKAKPMNATLELVTSNRSPHPISNRNPNQPTPRVTPTKQTKALIISNRESLRLEIHVTPTKQRPDHLSNREKEAWFSAPVGEGVYLPPGLALGVGSALGLGLGVARGFSATRGASDVQNSNREGRRLETGVTPTKQRIRVSSNRELEPLFTAPALTTRNAGFQITPSARTAQKKAPRHLPRGF